MSDVTHFYGDGCDAEHGSEPREPRDIPGKSPQCTCPWAHRDDIGRLYGISMGPGWVRQSDADDCPDHARGRSHGGFFEEAADGE